MQMLDVYTTIANGGMARPPRLVDATIDADGKRHDAPLRRAAPGGLAGHGRRGDRHAEEGGVGRLGTGTKAQIAGYPVAGKTGTARKAPYDTRRTSTSRRSPGSRRPTTPRLAAIVVLDEPQGSIFGADVAAPVFQQIMQFALAYERVPTTTG